MSSLGREDKIWLSQLAALVVGAVNAIVCGAFKTQIAVERVKDILQFGTADKSNYLGPKNL
jgi:hypothetical protein